MNMILQGMPVFRYIPPSMSLKKDTAKKGAVEMYKRYRDAVFSTVNGKCKHLQVSFVGVALTTHTNITDKNDQKVSIQISGLASLTNPFLTNEVIEKDTLLVFYKGYSTFPDTRLTSASYAGSVVSDSHLYPIFRVHPSDVHWFQNRKIDLSGVKSFINKIENNPTLENVCKRQEPHAQTLVNELQNARSIGDIEKELGKYCAFAIDNPSIWLSSAKTHKGGPSKSSVVGDFKAGISYLTALTALVLGITTNGQPTGVNSVNPVECTCLVVGHMNSILDGCPFGVIGKVAERVMPKQPIPVLLFSRLSQ